jgi:hypothetical protein
VYVERVFSGRAVIPGLLPGRLKIDYF